MTQFWMHVKALSHWKWGNPADESIPESDNSGIEAKNDCEIEIEETEDESKDKSFPLFILCLTKKLCIYNVDCVNFNAYCVLSFRVNCLFGFSCSCVDAVVGCLKGINHDKIKCDTSLNSCKGPP